MTLAPISGEHNSKEVSKIFDDGCLLALQDQKKLVGYNEWWF
ncbi:MAG: hypothetical protein ACI90V_000463 [Bacillariaceae sp.]|jgi:hypothetical protein